MVDMNKIKKILIIIGIIVLAIISIPILIFFLPAIIGIMLLLVFTAWIWVPIVCAKVDTKLMSFFFNKRHEFCVNFCQHIK